jgi:hypothetical protein
MMKVAQYNHGHATHTCEIVFKEREKKKNKQTKAIDHSGKSRVQKGRCD